jgi:DNA polymerase III epsilon subunit-like protein
MTKPIIYSRAHPGHHLLVIDTETTGSQSDLSYEDIFKKYQAISFGAIVATSDTFEPVARLYFTLKYDEKYIWSMEAQNIHGLSKEHLEETGLTAEEGAVTLAEFILNHFGTGKVMVLGHNTQFDIAAMRQLLEPFSVMPDLHHVVLDTSPLGWMTVGKYRSTELFEFFLGDRPEKHNALGDAEMTLTVARSVRELMNGALSGL